MRTIRLWVDDQREPPSGFTARAKTYEQAINYLKTGKVTVISLDYVLSEEKSGYDIASWIEDQAFFGDDDIPPLEWSVHSTESIGRCGIINALQNADMLWKQHHRC
jgi:hypothetical protein